MPEELRLEEKTSDSQEAFIFFFILPIQPIQVILRPDHGQAVWGDWFMYFAAVALVGASLGQPPAALASPTNPHDQDVLYSNNRQVNLPIRYNQDRKTIKKVSLHYALNGENTWYLAAVATPDQDRFVFTAKDDGLYWFTIVDEDLQGHKNPDDLTKTPPDLKVIIDTVPPRVQFSRTDDCIRKGESITVVWTVEDKNPNENLTKVHFKTRAADSVWKEVSLPATSKYGVRFNSSTMEPVIVRVSAFDMAGNKCEEIFNFPAAIVAPAISANVPVGGPLGPVAPPAPPSFAPVAATAPSGVTPLSPPSSGSGGSVVPAGPPIPPPAMPVSTPARFQSGNRSSHAVGTITPKRTSNNTSSEHAGRAPRDCSNSCFATTSASARIEFNRAINVFVW
jgi:hypothetical protein